ncbi:MAG: hypothetical protein WA090_04795 [Candidatus Nanopelagicaceae bacterium]
MFRIPSFRARKQEAPFLVSRAYKGDVHVCSILAWNGGFEYIFRTGTKNWSTLSPSFARRTLDSALHTDNLKQPQSAREFMELSQFPGGSWTYSSPIGYSSLNNAIEIERAVLDEAWQISKIDRM